MVFNGHDERILRCLRVGMMGRLRNLAKDYNVSLQIIYLNNINTNINNADNIVNNYYIFNIRLIL